MELSVRLRCDSESVWVDAEPERCALWGACESDWSLIKRKWFLAAPVFLKHKEKKKNETEKLTAEP